MNLHELNNDGMPRKRRVRVGRGPGSGLGKTSGRGHKGAKSRTGYSAKAGFEGGQMTLIRRLPKVGFTNFTRVEFAPVNVGAFADLQDGTELTVEVMRAVGLVKGTVQKIKILGNGDLSRKLVVHAHGFSATARQKIEAAGGRCEVVK